MLTSSLPIIPNSDDSIKVMLCCFLVYMDYRIIKLIHPQNSAATVSVYKIPFLKKNMTIYDTVDFFRKEMFSKTKKTNGQKEMTGEQVLLRKIINLHNADGIKNIPQITSMINKIKSRKDILFSSEMPNIKLVKTCNNEWVLFDGHHSMLAYMVFGRKYLSEVPHLIIQNKTGCVKESEILVFFGVHSKKLRVLDWRDYVINWQQPKEKQLCRRVQENMGELFDSFKNKAKDNLAIR